jgi:hypothetical protein
VVQHHVVAKCLGDIVELDVRTRLRVIGHEVKVLVSSF